MSKLQDILDVYNRMAAPSQAGANAGTRTEGAAFKRDMTPLLTPGDPEHRIVIITSTCKSTDGVKVDGNAAERQSHKMLQFKLDPLMQDHLLILALNKAFEKYDNKHIGELREHAAWLNALNDRAQILVLSRPEHYAAYHAHAFGGGA